MHAFWCDCSRRSSIVRLVVLLGISLGMFPRAAAAGPGDIVLYASDVTRIQGAWERVPERSAAGGTMMRSRDSGLTINAPLAAPQDYFEASFYAQGNTPYRIWLRLSARTDKAKNDSVWVQFSDALNQAGSPVWRAGSTQALLVALQSCDDCGISGWGWADGAWWIQQNAVVKFPTSGNRTIRVQTREDGVRIDQIVLSPSAFFFSSPGTLVNDTTIVPKGMGTATPRAPEVVLYAAEASRRSGNWTLQDDGSAALGKRNGSENHDWANAAAGALSSPSDYLEWTFNAVAGLRYRVWLRLSAADNSTGNDSVWVQLSNAVTSAGVPTYRIGTTSGLAVVLENCSGCGVSGWGWQRKGWWLADTGDVYFATTGTATLRVQTREDGVRIDQVVISPALYATSAPGLVANDNTLVLRDGARSSIPTGGSGQTPTTARYVVFDASTDHATLVSEYVLEVFVGGTDPTWSAPLVSKSLAKPTPVNGQISVDIAATTEALPAGTYFATMSAIGGGGRARSAPSSTFTR